MGFSINLTKDDVEQQLKGFQPLPAGTYDVEIVNVDVAYVKQGNNQGKPMYRAEYKVVTEDAYYGRKLFHTICLWEGAHYSLLQLMDALGYEIKEGALDVPDADDLIGKEISVAVKVVPHFNKERADDGEKVNEVNRILADKKASKGGGKKKLSFD